MKRYLVFSLVALSVVILVLSCAKPKRTNPYDPNNPNAPGTLLGQVTETEAVPLDGAKVSTIPATSDAISDSLGNYLIPKLTPQTYQVIVSAAYHDTAYYNVTIYPAKSVTLNPQLVFNGGGPTKGWIEGLVLKMDTTVIGNAMVVASRAGFADSAKSNASGFYRVPGLLPDIYRVVVRTAPPPREDSTYVLPVVRDTIVVSPNQRTLLNFTLFRLVWWNFENDTVSRQAQGWSSTRGGWQVRDTVGSRAYKGVDQDGLGAFTAPTPGRKCNTFSLNLSVLIPGTSPPPQTKVEVYFHTQIPPPSSTHYLAVIVDSGPPPPQGIREIRLYRVVSNSRLFLTSHTILGGFPRDTWHTGRVSYSGQVIELWVDGSRLIQYSDPTPLPVGGIGLGVTGATDATAFFDNLSLVY